MEFKCKQCGYKAYSKPMFESHVRQSHSVSYSDSNYSNDAWLLPFLMLNSFDSSTDISSSTDSFIGNGGSFGGAGASGGWDSSDSSSSSSSD